MDDSFTFRSTVPVRREIDPRVVKAAVVGALVALGIGLFARWVVASERESFSRVERRATPSEAEVTRVPLETLPSVADADADAEAAIRTALAAAEAAFLERGSFLDAGPAALNVLQPSHIFVDGPSTMPRVVSVASTVDTWAAAVRGDDGTCHWIRATSPGDLTRGIGLECTGAAALDPASPR